MSCLLHTIAWCYCGDCHSFPEIEEQFDDDEFEDMLYEDIQVIRNYCYTYNVREDREHYTAKQLIKHVNDNM